MIESEDITSGFSRVNVFIDGYNLYHSVENLKQPTLKWVNPRKLCEFFVKKSSEKIYSIKFFTAPPIHKPEKTQNRYYAFTSAIKTFDIEIIEGKFKQKSSSSYGEKESDVNLALAILEDAYEKRSDKQLIITNDSDISPAIRLAIEKNPQLKINIITPPLAKGVKASYDLLNASGAVNKKGKQTFFKTRVIKQSHLKGSVMPYEIIFKGKKVTIPNEYLLEKATA